MSINLEQACKAMARCRTLRQRGVAEAVLRGEFQSHLRRIFPDGDDERWINHYSEGTEAHTTIAVAGRAAAHRFIDNLIGSTTIEYEADLRITAKRDEGYQQVKDHAAGLIRHGVPSSQVRGILSDTVDWYAYDISLKPGIGSDTCTPEDIELIEVEVFKPNANDESVAEGFTMFLRRHLAREQSRPLVAENLALDLGLDSASYRCNVDTLIKLVQSGRDSDPSIELATDLWSRFVDHLESKGGCFRIAPYVDEVYLNILARLLGANVLAGTAIVSNDDELQDILSGAYFQHCYQINNLVEQDYFGWITRPTHIAGFLPVARKIQRDLYAYSFSGWGADEDLFGRLMTQLASRSQRKLLGQEWTPTWLARYLVNRCLDDLQDGEVPKIVDMCCGSGSILAEVIKAAKNRYDLNDIEALCGVVTGFDIDPLAVALAKTTWVITLATEIKAASVPVTIPIYHADSLFSVTPISASIPMLGESGTIDITLDGVVIPLPVALVQPEYRELFEQIVDWVYDEACEVTGSDTSFSDVETTLDNVAVATGVTLSNELRGVTIEAVHNLALRMNRLAKAGRNGIWAFILRNTYRPGLLAGQFNGLVSNPPWLAMSALADNPYRQVLARRATLYGVKPTDQSFPHLELGTTYLLHAVDRYLKPGAVVACLVPGTILNGHHHKLFRQRSYLTSDRPVAFSLTEVWQVSPGTFKYPGAALFGRKMNSPRDADNPVESGFVVQSEGLDKAEFVFREMANSHTAWVLEKGGLPAVLAGVDEIPNQGADILPRRAVCIEILNENGPECRVGTPTQDSRWGFTLKQAKELKNKRFPGYVAPCFIHRMAQSKNLLPFIFDFHWPPVAIPATRSDDGTWRIYEPADIRRMGFTRTAQRFAKVNKKLSVIGKKTLECRIDIRRKLTNQVFRNTGYLVLSGAGGKHICAACLTIAEAQKIVIDQTLYWQVITDEDEAWFRTSLLNSQAMTDAILPFNPEGNFGPRHIHTLPHRLIPAFDAYNKDCVRIATLGKEIAVIARTIVEADSYLSDSNRELQQRRRKLRGILADKVQIAELEDLCAMVLGTR